MKIVVAPDSYKGSFVLHKSGRVDVERDSKYFSGSKCHPAAVSRWWGRDGRVSCLGNKREIRAS